MSECIIEEVDGFRILLQFLLYQLLIINLVSDINTFVEFD